jgi:hypothetical protein
MWGGKGEENEQLLLAIHLVLLLLSLRFGCTGRE